MSLLLEILGTIAFAASGAVVAIEKKMDVFGIIVMGVITACGGGIIRDVLLNITPPTVFLKPIYVIVASVTSLIFFLAAKLHGKSRSEKYTHLYDNTLAVMDALGLAIFTVIGVHTGIRAGYISNGFLLVFYGTITGVGGGLMRDVFAGNEPYIFKKHIYACASILGAIACVYSYRYLGETASIFISLAVTLIIRFLAMHYKWNLPRVS